ncbi:protoporphyrinogen/coproporphyrinogen oxidase [Mucilaginibacter aquaedulcis]|uniref:protoporphyrinogen/coproporphyrinogen oxidase n=1 Tax=Mucilaginibacter aquaedulcis TaxID=1187081 RepID=UPI0025B2D650|nr:FAD-dependent oxidoreductase [Mucilaginibacter aquaedulcis]MDN3548764.1 FAD-dependent oxidoreductase [Mucilaginibacter aquaedulcis]
MSRNPIKIAVLGAGPAGLTAAHQLTKSGFVVDVYDTAKEVGGFAKSIRLWDRNVEIGPHFLDIGNKANVKELVLTALEGKYRPYQRRTFIHSLNKLFSYPPGPADLIKKLSTKQLLAATAGMLKQVFSVPTPDNGTAGIFVKKHLGEFLYKNFFESFCIKLWSLNGDQLSDVFAKALLGFNDFSSPVRLIARKLTQRFQLKKEPANYIYPTNGFSDLWKALKCQAELQGGKFYLGVSINKLVCSGSGDSITQLILADGGTKEYDLIICTIPVLSLIGLLKTQEGLPIMPSAAMNFRSDILVYLKVQFENAAKGQCIYIYSDLIKITRVTNFNEFRPDEPDIFNILLVEIWCDKTDLIWDYSDDDLMRFLEQEIKKTNLFINLSIIDYAVKKVADAFQIPDLNLEDSRTKLFDQMLGFRNLYITGRIASLHFNYGMENAIEDGIILADKITKQYRPELL